MNNKITVIEGPTPEFQVVSEDNFNDGSLNWVAGILEGPFLFETAFTNVRTFDSQKLLERCKDAWAEKQTMYLEYKDRIGLRKEDPIIAARAVTVEDGEMLLLWVRRNLSLEENEEFEDDPDLPF